MNEKDEVIVQMVVRGHKSCYEHLVKKYQNKIYQLIFRMTGSGEDALDLTQETFIQAYHSLAQFNKQSSFYTWLYRIASNKTLDFLRKKKRISDGGERLVSQYQFDTAVSYEKNNPEQQLIAKEQQILLKKEIGRLPDKYRIVIILNHYQGLSYQQISNVLDLPVKTVSTRIYRARMLLREKLLEGGKEYGLP